MPPAECVKLGLALTTALFVLFSYTTITGFHYDTNSIGRASVPFLEMADHYLGDTAILAWPVAMTDSPGGASNPSIAR